MRLKLIAGAVALGLAVQAHAESVKHVEQLESIYYCEQEAMAKGLVKAYDPADDFDIRQFVDDSEGQCGRFAPNAAYGFNVLFDTLHDHIVRIRLDEAFWQDPKVAELYWINDKQAFRHIQSDNNEKPGKPLSVTFISEVLACSTLNAAQYHAQLGQRIKPVGGAYIANARDTGNADPTRDFVCRTLPKGTRGDVFSREAQNGFAPVELYDVARTRLWIRKP